MDGAGVPPIVDGSGTPPLPPLTSGYIRPPDGQGVPPPPIDSDKTQVIDATRWDQCTVSCSQDYKGVSKVRKGLLKGNSVSWISAPTRHERMVQFVLPSREEQHDRPSRTSSSSSGPTPPIKRGTAGRSTGQGTSAATSSVTKLTRRHGGRGPHALSYTV